MADVYYGAPLPVFLPHRAVRRNAYRKCNTYLAMIACVLQDAPGKMLTFTGLMEKLEEFITGDRKCFENNIRVCLSSNNCFVKIPLYPRMPICKNYWKLDHSQITAKMVRRHFKEILGQFPELAPKMATDTTTHHGSPGPVVRRHFKEILGQFPELAPKMATDTTTHHGSPGPITTVTHTPEPAVCKAPPTRCSMKFSGPFSIESLLRRDSPSGRGPKPPPPPPYRSCQTVKVERQAGSPGGRDDGAKGRLSWDYMPLETLLPGSDKGWPFYTTWSNMDIHRVGDLGARPFKRMCMEPSTPPIQPRHGLAPYVAGPQSNPMSRYVCDVHHFRL